MKGIKDMTVGLLKLEQVDNFTVDLKDGFLYWKVKLKDDDNLYQIKGTKEIHITPVGNKSYIKVYFIRKNKQKLIFDDEVKAWFRAFRIPYQRDY